MTADPAIRPPRAPAKLRRAAAIVLALVATPIATYIVWDRVESSRLSRRLDVLFPRTDSTPEAAQDGPPTEEQKKAAKLYSEALELTAQAYGRPFDEAARIIAALSVLPPPQAARDPRLEALGRTEQAYSRALELLDRATLLDARGLEDAGNPPDLLRAQWIGRVNGLRIARQAFAGDGDKAAAALFAALRLRRVLPASFFSFRNRTTHSLQVMLSCAHPSDSWLLRLQQEYEAGQPERGVENVLVNQRTQLVKYVLPDQFGLPPGVERRASSPIQFVLGRLARPLFDHYLSVELEHFDEALQAAQQPWPEILESVTALGRKYGVPRPPGSRPASYWERLIPMWNRGAIVELVMVTPVAGEALARARVSIAALAVERYRRTHDGALPETLAQLVPASIAAVPRDPFTGGELRYRREASGYRIYSVGANREDEGGVWDLTSDLQMSRAGDPKDIGIAVAIQGKP